MKQQRQLNEHMPIKLMQKIHYKKMMVLNKWVLFQLVIFKVNQVFDLIQNKNELSLMIRAIEWVITFSSLTCFFIARYKNYKLAYLAFFFMMIRYYERLFLFSKIMESKLAVDKVWGTILLVSAALINSIIMSQTGLKYSTLIAILNSLIIIVGMMWRTYGGLSMSLVVIYQFLLVSLGWCAYSISILNQMVTIDNKTTADLIKIINKAQFEKQMHYELHEIFENLELGIVVVQNNSVAFTNHIFRSILSNINILNDSTEKVADDILDLNIFQLYRSDDIVDNSNLDMSESFISQNLIGGSKNSNAINQKKAKG